MSEFIEHIYDIYLHGKFQRRLKAFTPSHAIKLVRSEAGNLVSKGISWFGGGDSDGLSYCYVPGEILAAKDDQFSVVIDNN